MWNMGRKCRCRVGLSHLWGWGRRMGKAVEKVKRKMSLHSGVENRV